MKIDGKQIAQHLIDDLHEQIKHQDKNFTPHLAIVLVGEDPASVAYVNQKKKKGEAIGIKVTIHTFPETVTTDELLLIVQKLNDDPTVHGIIIQQPLPEQVHVHQLIDVTSPEKDVDGFHKRSPFTPPIAEAVLAILQTIAEEKKEDFLLWLRRQNVVVIGKGETGGAPIVKKLQSLNIFPLLIDSKTPNPQELSKKADIIISCVGKEHIVTPETIKKGAILMSIGMHRGSDGKLHGDYEEDAIKDIVSYYSPVPGGIGPVNVAMLLKNVVTAAKNT